MKLICDGLDLSDAINKVGRALPSKVINPVLEGIKLTAQDGKLTVFASDTELSVQRAIKAEIIEDGEVLVPGRFFSDYIKRLTDEQLELFTNEKNQLRIKYSDSEGFVQLLNGGDYPVFKEPENSQQTVILQRELKDSIEKTIIAVSDDESRPTLNGCLLEFDGFTLTTVALDGYRMAINKKPLEKESQHVKVIVPTRALNEIDRLLGDDEEVAAIKTEENLIFVDLGDTKVSSRLINGEFINYNQLLPQDFVTNIVVDTRRLENCLDRASLPSRQEKNNLVKFEIKENMLTIYGTSEMSNVKENINISLKGKDLNIAFNARFIADCLKVIKNEFIKMSFTSSISPSIITPCDTDESTYLVLPVRMVN